MFFASANRSRSGTPPEGGLLDSASASGGEAGTWQLDTELRLRDVALGKWPQSSTARFDFVSGSGTFRSIEDTLSDYWVDDQVRVVMVPPSGLVAGADVDPDADEDSGVVIFEGTMVRQQFGVRAVGEDRRLRRAERGAEHLDRPGRRGHATRRPPPEDFVQEEHLIMASIKINVTVEATWDSTDTLRLYVGSEGAASLAASTPSGGSVVTTQAIGSAAAAPGSVIEMTHRHSASDKCATNHTTLDAQGLAVAPGGGILALGKTVANAGTHLYDSVGVKQWTIENAINDRAVYVDALGLTYQWKAASVSNPKGDQLEVFDSSGTSIEIIEKADYVPAHPNGDDVDYDGHLAVNTCNPIGSVSRDIYCSGELTEGLGNPRRAWRTSGTDLVRGPVSGSAGAYLRIDGHWAIFT